MFDQYRSQIETELHKAIAAMGEKTRLREACEYALLSGGKRLRPMLVLMIAKALGHGLNAMPAALSVEFFHTASLIADDLPCMDNDNERRNRPSLHRRFEESVALLTSYTFIASGYEGIYKNGQAMKEDPSFKNGADEATIRSLEIATRCAGIFGATNGQFLDLFPPDQSLETIRKIIEQKTVTLFQISFVLGWLFGGGDPDRLPSVEAAAYHLGMAFQMADDLQDADQDASHAGEVNIARVLGREETFTLFYREMDLYKKGLIELGLWNHEFEVAVAWLYKLAPANVKPLYI
ncbi:MAG: polyprenyl synthetase family protein [Verrucomicrobiota bacterium]|nr:polyprenyl synthetase family protein [Verrucomicrobiota bacterium]